MGFTHTHTRPQTYLLHAHTRTLTHAHTHTYRYTVFPCFLFIYSFILYKIFVYLFVFFFNFYLYFFFIHLFACLFSLSRTYILHVYIYIYHTCDTHTHRHTCMCLYMYIRLVGNARMRVCTETCKSCTLEPKSHEDRAAGKWFWICPTKFHLTWRGHCCHWPMRTTWKRRRITAQRRVMMPVLVVSLQHLATLVGRFDVIQQILTGLGTT